MEGTWLLVTVLILASSAQQGDGRMRRRASDNERQEATSRLQETSLSPTSTPSNRREITSTTAKATLSPWPTISTSRRTDRRFTTAPISGDRSTTDGTLTPLSTTTSKTPRPNDITTTRNDDVPRSRTPPSTITPYRPIGKVPSSTPPAPTLTNPVTSTTTNSTTRSIPDVTASPPRSELTSFKPSQSLTSTITTNQTTGLTTEATSLPRSDGIRTSQENSTYSLPMTPNPKPTASPVSALPSSVTNSTNGHVPTNVTSVSNKSDRGPASPSPSTTAKDSLKQSGRVETSTPPWETVTNTPTGNSTSGSDTPTTSYNYLDFLASGLDNTNSSTNEQDISSNTQMPDMTNTEVSSYESSSYLPNDLLESLPPSAADEKRTTAWTTLSRFITDSFTTPFPLNTSIPRQLNETGADATGIEPGLWESSMAAGLIAALCFGVIFFVTVVVLLGRKLHESWKRRHYSKIDYLVNGMYN